MPFSKYSVKQKKLARLAVPRDKITAADLEVLRGETKKKVARKLEPASKALAGQAKLLKSLVNNGTKKLKVTRYVQLVKLGHVELLTSIHPLMRIWLLLSIARIPIMQRELNVKRRNNG